MTDSNYDAFLANIEGTLKKNGFPMKRVALPFERMYEIAYEKGLNFNKALDLLAAKGIAHEKTNEKVIFFPKLDDDMLARAQEMMKQMTPEQLAQIQKLYESLYEDERAEMLKRALGGSSGPTPG